MSDALETIMFNTLHRSPSGDFAPRQRPWARHTFAIFTLALTASATSAIAQTSVDNSGDLSRAKSVYVQGSWAEHGTDAATVGVTLPWKEWKADLWGGQVRGHWDLYVSRLSFDGRRSYDSTWMFGVKPVWRWRPDAGRSPWFAEAGVGLTYMTDRYITVHKEFSTSFNFATHLGVGYSFGVQRQHEVQLRVEHVSNAGIKEPNPGENFVQIRYGYHF